MCMQQRKHCRNIKNCTKQVHMAPFATIMAQNCSHGLRDTSWAPKPPKHDFLKGGSLGPPGSPGAAAPRRCATLRPNPPQKVPMGPNGPSAPTGPALPIRELDRGARPAGRGAGILDFLVCSKSA